MKQSSYTASPLPFTSSPSPSSANKGSLRYKQNVAALFQKLNALQNSSQVQKYQNNCTVLSEFNKKEAKVQSSNKQKSDQFKSILRAVSNIEKEIENQRNEEQKLRHNVRKMIETANSQLELSFERLEKERIKNQNNLQQWIQGKLESFILKNKNAWKQESLVDPNPFIQEINYQQKEHQKFLDNYSKQVNKLKKQIISSLQELLKAASEQVSRDYESEVSDFMKAVHMEVSGKLRGLEEQRQQTEQRVLQVLQRVVASCVPEVQ